MPRISLFFKVQFVCSKGLLPLAVLDGHHRLLRPSRATTAVETTEPAFLSPELQQLALSTSSGEHRNDACTHTL